MTKPASQAADYAPGDHWYVRRGRQVRGPFNSGKVRRYVTEGRLTLDDEVSQDRRCWRTMRLVDEVVPLQFRRGGESTDDVEVSQRRRDRRIAWLSLLVGAALAAGAVTVVVLLDQGPTVSDVDCTAPPMAGVAWHNCRLDLVQLGGADLRGAQLANATLTGADLARADLSDANLRYVDLAAADLAYARLTGADLTGANLRGADLTNADLGQAQLSFADLRAARIGGANLEGSNLSKTIWIDGRLCAANAVSDCP